MMMDLVSYHNQAILLLQTASTSIASSGIAAAVTGSSPGDQWDLGLEMLHQVTHHLTVELAKSCTSSSSQLLQIDPPRRNRPVNLQVHRLSLFRAQDYSNGSMKDARSFNDEREHACFEHVFLMETGNLEAMVLASHWGQHNDGTTSSFIDSIALSKLATACLAVCLYNEAIIRHVRYHRRGRLVLFDTHELLGRERGFQQQGLLSFIAARYESAIVLLTDIVPCLVMVGGSSSCSSSLLPMVVLAAATNIIHIALEQGDLDKARHWTLRLRSQPYADCVGVLLETNLSSSSTLDAAAWYHDQRILGYAPDDPYRRHQQQQHQCNETIHALSTIQVMSSAHDFCAAQAA